MKRAHAACLAWLAVAVCSPALAEEEPAAAKWSGSIAAYRYLVPDEPDFTVSVGAANRGSLRFEARHNYEGQGATSGFIGWKFAGGDANGLHYEVTPLAGAVGGTLHGGIAALEASVTRGPIDFYVEAEYVHDRHDSAGSYVYAWSELGWRPVEWLRLGLVGQRTRIVHDGRDIQHGLLAQATVGPATLALYAFNPEASARYTIVSLALAF